MMQLYLKFLSTNTYLDVAPKTGELLRGISIECSQSNVHNGPR